MGLPYNRFCSFCGKKIVPGTGKMYVRNDGRVLYFCSRKCQKNMLELRRDPKKVRWTTAYRQEKARRMHLVAKDAGGENAGPAEA